MRIHVIARCCLSVILSVNEGSRRCKLSASGFLGFRLGMTVFLLLFSAFLFSPIVYAASGPADAIGSDSKLKSYDLHIPVGSLVNISAADFASGKAIPTYIINVYRWGVGFTLVLAVIAMMVAGVIWILAGGNKGNVDKAKGILKNALVGIFLALGSYLFLWTISPNLVQFRPIGVANITSIELVDPQAALPPPAADPTKDPTGACCYVATDTGGEVKSAKLTTQTGCQEFVSKLINQTPSKAKLEPIYFCATMNISRETPEDVCWKVPPGFPDGALLYCDDKRIISPTIAGGGKPTPPATPPIFHSMGICCSNKQGRRTIIGGFEPSSYEGCMIDREESDMIDLWFCQNAKSSNPLGTDVCGARSTISTVDPTIQQWTTPFSCPTANPLKKFKEKGKKID